MVALKVIILVICGVGIGVLTALILNIIHHSNTNYR